MYVLNWNSRFVPKVTNKMASNEPAENSSKSPILNEVDTTVPEKKENKEESPVTPLVNENNELNNAANMEEKGPISKQDNATEEKKDIDDTVDENKHDLRSSVADKYEQEDDNKKDQAQNVKEETEKKETGSMTPPPPSQATDNTKDSNSEDSKNLVKVAAASKRKRKSQR